MLPLSTDPRSAGLALRREALFVVDEPAAENDWVRGFAIPSGRDADRHGLVPRAFLAASEERPVVRVQPEASSPIETPLVR